MMKPKLNRGGKRAGSGRKKRDPTITIAFRVPEQHAQEIKEECKTIIKKYKVEAQSKGR